MTGQLLFRDAGRHQNGKRLMMVVGVVSVPDNFPYKGEHQYTVAPLMGLDGVEGLVQIHLSTEIDHTKRIQGWGLGDTLTQPMWRVG